MPIYLLLTCRFIQRNGVVHEVKLKRGKLECDCFDSVYTGIPCRHMIMIANSLEEINYEALPFNQRWELDYYTELVPRAFARENPEEVQLNRENVQGNQELRQVIQNESEV